MGRDYGKFQSVSTPFGKFAKYGVAVGPLSNRSAASDHQWGTVERHTHSRDRKLRRHSQPACLPLRRILLQAVGS